MKKIFYFIAALALMCACNQEEKNPYRAEMEEFAKKSIPNPETYEFDHMGFEEEHQYVSELMDLREKIKRQMELPGADVEVAPRTARYFFAFRAGEFSNRKLRVKNCMEAILTPTLPIRA